MIQKFVDKHTHVLLTSSLVTDGRTEFTISHTRSLLPPLPGQRRLFNNCKYKAHHMDTILLKVFAVALAFSHTATKPDAVKTRADRMQDRHQVLDLLRGGCAQMRKAFDIENLTVDDLIATAMDDPAALAGQHATCRGINLTDLHTAYQ